MVFSKEESDEGAYHLAEVSYGEDDDDDEVRYSTYTSYIWEGARKYFVCLSCLNCPTFSIQT